jgi:hypothetical protein
MNNEILVFARLLMSTKANVILFAVLAFFVAVTINGNIVSNIIKWQQASALDIFRADSLSKIIKEKVASAINQSTSANNKTTVANNQQSTNINCVNNKCVTTICVNNQCHTTTTTNTSSANSASINIATISIGDPFYKQNDKATSQKPVVVNGIHASEISFSGTGTANGTSFRDTGKALVMPRASGATYVQGNAVIMTNNTGEKATYTFQEIGHSAADGTISGNGAAFFGSDATGKLAFLNNVVAIYKDQIDKAGNSKVIAWKWK